MLSIILPVLNEEKNISNCLDSVVNQNYAGKMEVLIIDGMSSDGSRNIVKKYMANYPFIKLLDNPNKITPCALNIGIRNACGEIIIRLDAHSIYDKNYVANCIKFLEQYDVDNVGGCCVTLPGSDTPMAKANAMVLSHSFGVGDSYFRIGAEQPKYVDTVPFGCYRKKIFEKIGLFNENLIRAQDLEFNLRLKEAGGKILLVPDVISYYIARSSLKDLFKQNFWSGFWVIYGMKFTKFSFLDRHLVPFIFVASLLISFLGALFSHLFVYLFALITGSYLLANIFFSFKLSIRHGFKYFVYIILAFITLHFSYGLGSLWGMVKLSLLARKGKNV
jgi:glycosyltransferase involved in cell wall biosynthesis